MTTPILATKLYPPPPRAELLARRHLLQRLDRGLDGKLTLLSAPAGFGKSTLASAWLATLENGNAPTVRTAWLALDEDDGNPNRFLTYLLAALQEVDATIGAESMAQLQSGQPPPVNQLLIELVNALSMRQEKIVLSLDDYHAVDAPAVDEALAFLLDHQPPQLHLLMTTREDPRLPLARLRARGQLTELRAADLRFTTEEAATFLHRVTGLVLSSAELGLLTERTEGWIAGLQLAALSMQGRNDVGAFVQAFAGDHRYVVDYLVEEVLERQPPHVRTFLLQTSILDRLTASLCEAVTDQAEGGALLDQLERSNLFVIPLDDARRWFRYHHLFADVLRAHFVAEHPKEVSLLHSRAAAWHEEHGAPADAIRHALAAQDYGHAAALIEATWRAMDRSFQAAAWLRWAQALPDAFVKTRPVLSAGYGWALLDRGDLAGAIAHLDDAERWLDPSLPSAEAAEMAVTDEAEFAALPVTLASARAYHAQALGDVAATIRFARQALDHTPKDDVLARAIPAAILGLAYWTDGDLAAAHATLTQSMNGFLQTGNALLAISGATGLADMLRGQGQLRDARATCDRWLELALTDASAPLRGATDLYLSLAELAWEQGEVEAAAAYLVQSERLGEQAGAPQWPSRHRTHRARLAQSGGDFNEALRLLDEAEARFIQATPLPVTHPFPARRAQVWLVQDRLEATAAWATEQGVAVDNELGYLREFEHLTLARLLIAQGRTASDPAPLAQAQKLLARLLDAAQADGRWGSVLEIWLLQALAYAADDEIDAALGTLAQALGRAEPEGYVRLFVDEGAPMAALLRAAAERGIASSYVTRLLGHFAPTKERPQTPSTSVLIEPLSERESDVLRLLATELSGPELAQELIISLNTLRTHTKNIYSKLGVNSRRAAVNRAKELGLL